MTIPQGGRLLFFTDGLTDGIGGENPEEHVCEVIGGDSGPTVAKLKSLINPKFSGDDITILLLTRVSGAA